MPISLPVGIRRISQHEFGELSFEVMRHVFSIHNEIGRFLDEKIYKRALAQRMAGVRLEQPIDVTFGSFRKRYFIDVLVGDGGLFEFKAVDSLTGSHRAQLLHYLMLCGVAHGKLINGRPETVDHEFVNSGWQPADRMRFEIRTTDWNAILPGAANLLDFLTAMLRDLGTGLAISLYEEAVTHCFGGMEEVEANVAVAVDGQRLGEQRMRLISPGVAFKITAFGGSLDPFEVHARRLLSHVELRAIAWVNVGMKEVTFKTLEK